MGRVFANGPGELGSIPGRVIQKDFKKWYLIPPCLTLSNIRYISRVVKQSRGGCYSFPWIAPLYPWYVPYIDTSLLNTQQYKVHIKGKVEQSRGGCYSFPWIAPLYPWYVPYIDTSLLNTQQYKVRIKGKVEQSKERSNALPYMSV